MKNYLLLSVAASLATAAMAQVSVGTDLSWNRPARVEQATPEHDPRTMKKSDKRNRKSLPKDPIYNYQHLFSEDFSKLTAGSEDAPAPGYIEDENEKLPDSYFNSPGWYGSRIQSAGGNVYIDSYNGSEWADEGMIEAVGGLWTPEIEVNSNGVIDVTVSMRLKSLVEENHLNIIPAAKYMHGSLGFLEIDEIYGTDWQDLEYTFMLPEEYFDDMGDGEQMLAPLNTVCFRITGALGPIMIDEMEMSYKTPKVTPPANLHHTDFKTDGFTLRWDAVEGAEKYLLTLEALAINEDFDYDITPILEEYELTENQYHYSGDTAGSFRAVVKAVKNNIESPLSDYITIFDVVAPEMTGVSEVSETEYTATWTSVEGASAYEAYVQKEFSTPSDMEYEIARLDFSSMTAPEDEDDYDTDDVVWLDEYAVGWMVQSYPEPADGGLLLDNFAMMYGNPACRFMSSSYDLSNNDGIVNVSLTASSESSGDVVVAMAYLDETGSYATADAKVVTLSPELKKYDFQLEGGSSDSLIGIQFVSPVEYLVADITLSQSLKKGDSMWLPEAFDYTEETSSTFTYPTEEFSRVKVSVRSYKYEYIEFYGMQMVVNSAASSYSAPIVFDNHNSGVDSVSDSTAAELTELWDLQGRRLKNAPNPGIYVGRRADGTSIKVLVK